MPWVPANAENNMVHSNEKLLIRYCAKISFNNNIELIFSEKLDWDYILEESRDNSIAPFLYYHLAPYQKNIPADIFLELKNTFDNAKQDNHLLYQELQKIILSFKEKNIKFILLKGIDLAKRVYPDIGLRPMTDIDILVRKEDLPKIEEALIPLNYLMYPNYYKVLDKPVSPYLNAVVCKKLTAPFISLHLHWHIYTNTFFPFYGYISSLDIERIWQNAETTEIEGQKVLRINSNDLILHLSQHHFKHYFNSLIYFTDIDALLTKYKEKLDWQKVTKDAFEFNLDRPLYYSLYFTKNILKTDISEGILKKLQPKNISLVEKKFVDSVLEGKSGKNLSYFMFLAMNKSFVKKLRFIFRTAFPEPEFKFQLQEITGIDSGFKYTINHISKIFRYIF